MSTADSIFARQNHWLKLLIFFLTLLGGMFALPRHLIYQTLLFALYFVLQSQLFGNILFAMRKLLPFFAAYWLFATILGVELIEMSEFSIRIVYMAFGTVYFFATLNISSLLAETFAIRQTRLGHKAFRFLIATMLFIRGYQRLFLHSGIKGKTSMAEVLNAGICILKQNLEQVATIETSTDTIISTPPRVNSRLSGANLVAVLFICLSMLLYAL
ncbi:MAG: hypothetical protein U1C33_00975 [Candidatus Cloacimonadaceae bacterium]|nr:hypothetical protein [Candidatus Cloacimonadaceae bacterium]